MSDKPSNYELDDELLSAYLDGELSANERAAVEARLATDPAAQQLLHELRSVSQSVQALPTKSLGRDLSDDILRRARVVRGSPDPAPTADRRSPSVPSSDTASGDIMPKIRIFNSTRSWIWATMALAAGLLIMFVQSRQDAERLPNVAARNRDAAQATPAEEAARSADRERSISAEPMSPPPAAVAVDAPSDMKLRAAAAPPSSAAPVGGETRGGLADTASLSLKPAEQPAPAASPVMKAAKEGSTASELPGATSAPIARSEALSSDKFSSTSQPAGRISGSAGASMVDPVKQKAESLGSPDSQRLLIVRVVAKSEALKSGSVERLLANNKIEFVPQPPKGQPESFGGGKLAKPAKSDSASKQESDKFAEIRTSEPEMVLVDAPQPAIESCLADLNKNSSDFVSVDINEALQSHDRIDKSGVSKSLAENKTSLSRFSRGTPSPAQQTEVDLRNYLYSYGLDKLGNPVANAQPRVSGAGPEGTAAPLARQDANGGEKWDYKDRPLSGIRRARSIETWGIDTRQTDEAAATTGSAIRTQASAQAIKKIAPQRKLDESSEAKINKNEIWKVLFVFTPEEAAAPAAPTPK